MFMTAEIKAMMASGKTYKQAWDIWVAEKQAMEKGHPVINKAAAPKKAADKKKPAPKKVAVKKAAAPKKAAKKKSAAPKKTAKKKTR